MLIKSKLLIIDDSKMNISILKNLFNELYEIYTADNGQSGIQKAIQVLPDLILLDIVMPDIDGFQVIQNLKTTKETSKIPIIFITGLNDPANEEKGLSLGAVDFITKPFNPITIKARVKNHIEMKAYRDFLSGRLDMNVQSLQEAIKRNIELDYLLNEAGEIAKIGFYIYYKDEDIFYWSPEMYQLLNIDTSKIPDSNEVGNRFGWLLSQVHPEDRKNVLNILDQQKEKSDKCDIQFRIEKDNKTLYYRSIFKNLKDNQNKKKVIGVIQDISDFKIYELEILEAKKTAEEANNLKSELLRNLGHELRTPLNGILGMIELSLMSENPDNIKQNITCAKESTLKLAKLINEIIEFSKLTSRDLKFDEYPFVFKNFFHMLVNNFQQSIAKKNLDFVYNYTKLEELIVYCDPKYLEKLFSILIENSIKFTPEGKIEIHADIDSQFNDKYLCHFKIIDSGIGISIDNLPKIFDTFFQIDSEYTRKYEGIGLGLAFAKKIADFMYGKIWYEENLPKGSIFHVLLPLKVKK